MASKRIVVLVDGAPQGGDLLNGEIEPGTTARDVLRHFGLINYALLLQGQTTHLSGDQVLWSIVEDGAKLRATPIAEVGALGWRRLFRRSSIKGEEPGTPQQNTEVSAAVHQESIQPAASQSLNKSVETPKAEPTAGNRSDNSIPSGSIPATERRFIGRNPVHTRMMQRRMKSMRIQVAEGATATPPVNRISPSGILLWQERGWKKQGNKLVGVFRTRRGGFVGEIILNGGDAGTEPSYYVFSPPPLVLKTSHAACWRQRGDKRYWVHFASKAPLDAGIAAIESQLTRFE